MINDDTLLLYALDDGLTPTERDAVTQALASDAALMQRLQQLQADLAQLTPGDAPMPVDTAQRWHAALERAAAAASAPTPAPPRPWFRGFVAWGVAGSLCTVVAAVLMNVPAFRQILQPPAQVMANTVDDPLRLLRSARWSLAEADQQLQRMRSMAPAERGRALDDVLQRHRLLLASAERAPTPAPALTRNLRALTPVMEGLAVQLEGSAELEAGIAQLGFEMKVIQARLAQQTGDRLPTQDLTL
jgi:hypothetical protein